MAKKKPLMGRPPKTTKSRTFNVRGTEMWLEWIAAFAGSQRLKPQDLVDQALAAFAEAKKFRAPPKRVE